MNRSNKDFWLAWLVAVVALAFLAAPLLLKANEEVKDPVCGMNVDPGKAKHRSEYQGTTYYFCSEDCKSKFDGNPAQYVKKEAKPKSPGMAMMHQEKHEHGKEPCCAGMMKDVQVEVTNLPNGVQVKITSEKPDVVKKIQEMHKEGKEMGCCMTMKRESMGCPMKKVGKAN